MSTNNDPQSSVTAVLHDDELTRVQGKVADAMLAARAKEQA